MGRIMGETPGRRAIIRSIRDSNGCLIFQGCKVVGYGQLRVNGRTMLAHRVTYEEFVGPIPPGLVIDHLCRTPACVNPEHLEAVPQRINILRGDGPDVARNLLRERHKGIVTCIRGHAFDAENTYITPDGFRRCRRCHRDRERARAARKRESQETIS